MTQSKVLTGSFDRSQGMIVRTGEPDDIPALQAIEKKARTVYAALAGFEFVAASPPIAAAVRLVSSGVQEKSYSPVKR